MKRPRTPLMDIRREHESICRLAGVDPYEPIPYGCDPTPEELAAIDARADTLTRWETAEELAAAGWTPAAHVGDAVRAVFLTTFPDLAARRVRAAALLDRIRGIPGICFEPRPWWAAAPPPIDPDLLAQVVELQPELWDLLDEPEPPATV